MTYNVKGQKMDREQQLKREKQLMLQSNLIGEKFKNFAKHVSTELKDGRLEIVWRYTPLVIYPAFPSQIPKDVCIKYVLEVVDGQIEITSRTEGKIEPAQTIPEVFVYEEQI